ncbi:MAG: activator of HSP90 ATPase [Saprospiraceae bacterium]|jgi:activator of HSP90 ATPase
MHFTTTSTIPASPQEIYEAWLSSKGHTQMTGGAATASNKVGGKFRAWDGYITGKNIALEPNSSIKQSWRTSEFQNSEEDSLVEIRLIENGINTILTLTHTNLPEHGEQYKNGWEEHYFQPMKEYFGKKTT